MLFKIWRKTYMVKKCSPEKILTSGVFHFQRYIPWQTWHFLFSTASITAHHLGKRIFNSPMLCTNLKSCCDRVKIKPLLMIQAVPTRWNTTARLIGRAKDLCLALNLLINMEQHNKMWGVCLKQLQLSMQEWELLLQLYPLLDMSCHWVGPLC